MDEKRSLVALYDGCYNHQADLFLTDAQFRLLTWLYEQGWLIKDALFTKNKNDVIEI